MTADYVPAYVHHPAGIRTTAADLQANLGTIADYLQDVTRPGQVIPADLGARLDVVTDAVLAAERLVAELAAEVTA
jgi:hypothetical protein